MYGLSDAYLTNDVIITDKIMERFILFLLEGHTINKIKVKAGTIGGYMKCVNDHYHKLRFNKPFGIKSDMAAAKLLQNVKILRVLQIRESLSIIEFLYECMRCRKKATYMDCVVLFGYGHVMVVLEVSAAKNLSWIRGMRFSIMSCQTVR